MPVPLLDLPLSLHFSMIAASILKARGFENVIDVAGGFGAIKKTALPKAINEYNVQANKLQSGSGSGLTRAFNRDGKTLASGSAEGTAVDVGRQADQCRGENAAARNAHHQVDVARQPVQIAQDGVVHV